MKKAIAIAIYQPQNPFKAALDSAQNSITLLADLMYGTPKRAERTVAFTVMFFALVTSLSMLSKTFLQTCPV